MPRNPCDNPSHQSKYTDLKGTIRCRDCKRIASNARAVKRKQQLVDAAGGSCSKCGYDRYIGALEFHHRSGDKLFNLSERDRSMEALLEEARKCILLCANCHREEHRALA